MLILEFNQYNKYLDDKKFMLYFNELNERVKELFPNYNLNLELIIDRINLLYYEKYTIDDAINNLYLNGYMFKFYSSNGDS